MLKFIFYTIIILWLVRKIGGFFFKSWFQSAINEQQKRAQEQYGHQNGQKNKREGDIFFTNKKSNKESKSDKIGGEYVDYEEIKD